jgi:tripartite-type tricarboxylate transporter receptor subunit TctC
MVAQLASKHLGQAIVVENKPGAGGTLGAVQVANNAKPDGYTITQIPLGVFRFPHMQKTQYDPKRTHLHHRAVRLYVRPGRGPTRRTRRSTT